MQSFAHAHLDQFLFESFFRGKRDGVFVDVGARDGRRQSNSLFFERSLGWHGLCVEPQTGDFSELVSQRRCRCEQARVCERSDAAADVAAVDAAPLRDLGSLLEKHALRQVDYCSIDTGGGEFAVLEGLDPERFAIRVFSVHNDTGDERVAGVLRARGYNFVANVGGNWVFTRRDVRRLARTSVVCAVWHRDEERVRLLEGHAANLARQSASVEPIYVFDGADEPPVWLAGRKVVVHEALSIYQAWNVALAMVTTPFVMNLNLDDRLAPNAVERLEGALLNEGAALAAGDWRVCYSQQETDVVEDCFPAGSLPFVADWPPPHGTRTRLGIDQRGTLGPATLWRMDAHIGAPRYPWRLADGTVLKVAGDVGWWQVLTQHLQKKVVRLPEIIGNYHSHPAGQAEFRGAQPELALMSTVGVSLL
ncbi:MAG TPA: FkbM family methyltransferase [Steroidobacteraceae bacterium]|nr:FkbM family methyltransferase [Steroidobacteraceae bacterium]